MPLLGFSVFNKNKKPLLASCFIYHSFTVLLLLKAKIDKVLGLKFCENLALIFPLCVLVYTTLLTSFDMFHNLETIEYLLNGGY